MSYVNDFSKGKVMTFEQLAEIEARAAGATPGPWEIMDNLLRDFIFSRSGGEAGFRLQIYPNSWDKFLETTTAEFIAHARTDIPALIAEIRRLQVEVAGLQAQLSDFEEANPWDH